MCALVSQDGHFATHLDSRHSFRRATAAPTKSVCCLHRDQRRNRQLLSLVDCFAQHAPPQIEPLLLPAIRAHARSSIASSGNGSRTIRSRWDRARLRWRQGLYREIPPCAKSLKSTSCTSWIGQRLAIDIPIPLVSRALEWATLNPLPNKSTVWSYSPVLIDSAKATRSGCFALIPSMSTERRSAHSPYRCQRFKVRMRMRLGIPCETLGFISI